MAHQNNASDKSSSPVVLITGCSSGIGKALARQFHQAGMKVCATARRLESMDDLGAEGIMTMALDVCDQSQIDSVLAELASRGMHVHTLVNNAGYGAMGPLLDTPIDVWRDQYEVNLFAPVAMIRAVAPGMVTRRSGRIVNISSISGVAPTPFAALYCSSKAALTAMADTLRMELAPFGIPVITVQPGGILSSFGASAGTKLSLAADSAYLPIKEGVLDRAQEGQKNAMPADQFAKLVVEALANPGCPPVIRLGEKSRLLPALKRILPDRVLDGILSKRFKLNELAQKIKNKP